MRVYVGLYRGHILVARVTLLPSYLEQEEVRQLSSGVGDAGSGVVEEEEEGDRRAGRVAVEPAGSRSPSVSVFPAVSVPESLAACGLALVLCMDP